MPAANTVTKTTTARPIISAAAVTAVRPGLRTAFSRARRPVMPRSRSSGQPATDASGRTSRGLNMDTPSSVATAPPPTSPAAVPEESKLANRPAHAMPIPISVSSAAKAANTRPRVRLSGSSASRSAAIGETRVARSAGTSAAASVTTIPTTSATITVRASTTVPVFGRSIPKLSKTALRPLANPSPATTPRAEPSAPMIVASSSIPVSTCPRVAPSVRSSPSSRMRWATVIANVLKIRKLPTSSATPPDDEQHDAEERQVVLDVLRLALGRLRPRLDEVARRQRGVDAARQLARRDAVVGLDGDAVEAVLLLHQPLCLGQRQLGGARPARGRVPEPLDAGDPVRLDAGGAGDAEACRRCRGPPGRRWPRRRRPRPRSAAAAVGVGERLERLGRDRGDELGREAGAERIAVLVDEAGGGQDAAGGALHAVDPAHPIEHAWREGGRLHLVALRGGAGADRDVGALRRRTRRCRRTSG